MSKKPTCLSLLNEVRHQSGVEIDDERMGYVVIQINRTLWDDMVELLQRSREEKQR